MTVGERWLWQWLSNHVEMHRYAALLETWPFSYPPLSMYFCLLSKTRRLWPDISDLLIISVTNTFCLILLLSPTTCRQPDAHSHTSAGHRFIPKRWGLIWGRLLEWWLPNGCLPEPDRQRPFFPWSISTVTSLSDTAPHPLVPGKMMSRDCPCTIIHWK